MFRNKDVSFLKSDALKLSWYEYFLLDMILMVVGILTLSLLVIVNNDDNSNHRRRINTEDKAKVVAVVLGTEFIYFLAMLAILH